MTMVLKTTLRGTAELDLRVSQCWYVGSSGSGGA
jgi:hypothetical protein